MVRSNDKKGKTDSFIDGGIMAIISMLKQLLLHPDEFSETYVEPFLERKIKCVPFREFIENILCNSTACAIITAAMSVLVIKHFVLVYFFLFYWFFIAIIVSAIDIS